MLVLEAEVARAVFFSSATRLVRCCVSARRRRIVGALGARDLVNLAMDRLIARVGGIPKPARLTCAVQRGPRFFGISADMPPRLNAD